MQVVLIELRRLGYRRIGLVKLNAQSSPRYSGVVFDTRSFGAAVDYLVAMLNRHERGIPKDPQRIRIEGRWQLGEMVRAQN